MSKQAKEMSTEQRGNLMLWKPVAEMARWEREIERMLGNFLTAETSWFDERSWPGSNFGLAEPSVDLYEEKTIEIVVKAELPGTDQGRY